MNSTQGDAGPNAYNDSDSLMVWGDITDDGGVQTIISVTTFLLTVLLLTLNPLCLVTLRHVDSIPEATKVFLQSLTSADLLMGVTLAFPMTVSTLAGTWVFGNALCALQAFVVSIFSHSAVFSVLLLTIDRYISVVYALQYSSLATAKRAWIAVSCAWGVSVFRQIWICSESSWIPHYHDPSLQCFFYPSTAALWVSFGIMVGTACVIIAMYMRLFRISHRHARRIQADHQVVGGRNRPAKPNRKSLNTFLIITLTSMLCLLIPAAYISLFYVFPSVPKFVHTSQLFIFTMSNLPLLTSGWLNVAIYYLRNKDIRQAMHAVLISSFTFFKRLCLNRGFNSD